MTGMQFLYQFTRVITDKLLMEFGITSGILLEQLFWAKSLKNQKEKNACLMH